MILGLGSDITDARRIAKVGADRIYRTTGIQFMALNSLYSLYAHKLADPQAFATADRLLFIPDLFHYWLSGELTTEDGFHFRDLLPV